MKRLLLVLIIVGVFVSAGIGIYWWSSRVDRDIPFVSIVQLLANPGKFEHEYIYVSGYCVWSEDGTYLSLSKEHADNMVPHCAIRIVGKNWTDFKDVSNRYVIAKGRVERRMDKPVKAILNWELDNTSIVNVLVWH
jgi:hypothetical protein